MNSETQTFELGKPMTWTEFKAMPENVQREYIEKLVKKFNVGPTALAEMFGCTSTTCSKRIKDLGVKLPEYSHANNREAFMQKFVFKKDKPHVPTNDDAFSTLQADAGQAAKEQSLAITEPKATSMMLTKTTLSFSGSYNAKLIADKLAALFDDGVNVTVTIDIQMTE